MLGSIGNDKYGQMTISMLKQENVDTRLIDIIDNMDSSKCAIGVLNHERSLLSQSLASAHISLDFVKKNEVIL